jgi:hypothetical protein
MKYRGKEYKGDKVVIAILDSGLNRSNAGESDLRFEGKIIEGCSIAINDDGVVMLSGDYNDTEGHGTEVAATCLSVAPEAEILMVKVATDNLAASAEVLAAGIETSLRHGARIINISMGCANPGRGSLLRDAVSLAANRGAVVVAAGHVEGRPSFPADFGEVAGVLSHPDCPETKYYRFEKERFDDPEWGRIPGKFLENGFDCPARGEATYRGAGLGSARFSGRLACMTQALGVSAPAALAKLSELALSPDPEIGYE